ncbi:transcription factor [Fusarium coicis]|nr:transcription factor [Fusarium coicis]
MRSASQYQRHVGRHQEQVALFALPTVESDDKDEVGSESDSSAGSMVMIESQDEQGDDTKQPEEPPTSHSMPRTDEKSSVPPNDLRNSMTGRQNEYFLPRDGIDREVISADICRYLGNDALVRPGHYEHPQTGQAVQGYFISAYRNLTAEKEEKLSRDKSAHVQYRDSEVHLIRQQYGPG